MTRKPDEMIQLKLRFREDLRCKVEEAAEQNGNSLNAEIVTRLRNSFELENELGGPTGLRLFRAMAFALTVVEQRQGDWRTDCYAFAAAKAAVGRVMDEIRPPYGQGLKELVELSVQADEKKEQVLRLRSEIDQRLPRKAAKPVTNSLLGSILSDFDPLRDATLGDVDLDVELATRGISGEDAELVKEYQSSRRASDLLNKEVDQLWSDHFAAEKKAQDNAIQFIDAAIERARSR